MKNISNHSQSAFLPSELVTLGMLFAIKGVGQRAFYRWIKRDYADWFPDLPERTRLFRRRRIGNGRRDSLPSPVCWALLTVTALN